MVPGVVSTSVIPARRLLAVAGLASWGLALCPPGPLWPGSPHARWEGSALHSMATMCWHYAVSFHTHDPKFSKQEPLRQEGETEAQRGSWTSHRQWEPGAQDATPGLLSVLDFLTFLTVTFQFPRHEDDAVILTVSHAEYLRPSQTPVLKPCPWCEGVWRWGLWEVIRLSEVRRVPMMGLVPLSEEEKTPELTYCLWTQQEDGSASQEALTRNRLTWHLDLEFLVSRTIKNTCSCWSHPVCGIHYYPADWDACPDFHLEN